MLGCCHKQMLGCCHKQTRHPRSCVPRSQARVPERRSRAQLPAAGALCSLSRGSMSSPGRSEAAEQTLLVGNLESRVREEILYELFLQAGPLTKVTICEDKEGKPKSFGYVCFKHKVSVPYAKALLDGIRLYGRPITVQYWRGSSHSPELDSCTDGFEHHSDLNSPPDRHQELSGNSPLPVAPLPENNSLLHDHPGFQKVNQTAQFKTAQSSPELAISKCTKRDERKRKWQTCDNDTSTEDNKRRQRQRGQNFKKKKAKKKTH